MSVKITGEKGGLSLDDHPFHVVFERWWWSVAYKAILIHEKRKWTDDARSFMRERVMDYQHNGTLMRILEKQKGIPEVTIREILRNIEGAKA
jgi:hypothetical protein